MTKKEASAHVYKVYGLRRGDAGHRKMVRKVMATIEHIVPKHLGGTNAQTNLVMTHAGCNSRRQTGRLTYSMRVFQRLPNVKQKKITKFNNKVDNELPKN